MNSSSLRYWLALLVLGGAFFGWSIVHANRPAAGVPYEPRNEVSLGAKPNWPPLTDFLLVDQDGKPFDSATLRGHVWVASFFFTNCPAVCWRLNQAIAALRETLGASDVRFVSITCDPDNDTPEKLGPYAKHFQAEPGRWTFLTGEISTLRDVAKQFLVALDKGSHSSRVFVVDRGGKVRAMFSLTEPGEADRLQKLLAKLEAEPAPPSAPAAPPSSGSLSPSADSGATAGRVPSGSSGEEVPSEAAAPKLDQEDK